MFDLEGTKQYWYAQTKKGDNPCHYHNKWQDKYAFKIRTSIFRQRDFAGMRTIVDVGCGVGDYTNALSELSEAKFIGFDYPFNIEIAEKKYSKNLQLSFVAKSLPDIEMVEAIAAADAVVMTTVYTHLALEARNAFFEALVKMKKGAKVMILEYMPEKIPDFQKKLNYKAVETPDALISRFKTSGFKLKEMRHVNFIDSFLFFHVGKNFVSYFLTLFLDSVIRFLGYKKSKYKLLIFEKVV